MSKHTQGPWTLDESRHMGCINRLEPYKHIGMVSAYQKEQGDAEENRANAQLISAAPDLYSAAESARCVLVAIRDGSMSRNNQESMIDEAIDELEKAAAKARGE